MKISFVIPARDAASTIGMVIASIMRELSQHDDYEVIVVDNGSVDDTKEIARVGGARVVDAGSSTIAGVRNIGAQAATGDILAFIDADVTLEDGWLREFDTAAIDVLRNHFSFTGSSCSIPEDASWLERSWFGFRVTSVASHIGSGHLIVSRKGFESIGGFDEKLATGEDYDLCQRLLANGGQMVQMSSSAACHHDNPRTIREFVRRESWHGVGDCRSLRAICSSRVALASLVFGGLNVLIVGAVLGLLSPGVGLLSLTLLACLCLVSSLWAYRGSSVTTIALNGFLYYCYYAARLSSFPRSWLPSLHFGWKRESGIRRNTAL